LARTMGASKMSAKITLLGTPGYVAPELLSGSAGDARSDLYAVGAILFEMLTGRRAFAARDPFEALRLQRQGPPALEGPEGEAVRRALEPDPEKRFVDADQMLRALGGSPVPDAPAV